MELEQFEINGIKVTTFPLKPLLCLRLDKKVVSLVLSTLGGKEEIDFLNFDQVNVNSLLKNFADALENLDDDEYLKIVISLLSSTQIDGERESIQIKDENSFNKAFSGVSPLTINKILLKIMEYNSFSPFEMAANAGLMDFIQDLSGSQTTKIHTLQREGNLPPKT